MVYLRAVAIDLLRERIKNKRIMIATRICRFHFLVLLGLKVVSDQTNWGSKVGSIDRYWYRTVALDV